MTNSDASTARDAASRRNPRRWTHRVYGISLRAPWRLAGVPAADTPNCDVELVEGDPAAFARAAAALPGWNSGRYQAVNLPHGGFLCRWPGLFDFTVSPDARRIEVLSCSRVHDEGFQAYLLSQALAVSMVKLGHEPLHATAVLFDGGVAAFIGDSGYGKSTLGALMVEAGCPLVTDDMLVATRSGQEFLAHPGPARLKLYPHMAETIFGSQFADLPSNPLMHKVIIPAAGALAVARPHRLRALYVIQPPQDNADARPRIERVPPGDAFALILEATINNWTADPERLERLFRFATELARAVPVKRLTYVRDVRELPALRAAVLADLASPS